jgi:hypothetical protein
MKAMRQWIFGSKNLQLLLNVMWLQGLGKTAIFIVFIMITAVFILSILIALPFSLRTVTLNSIFTAIAFITIFIIILTTYIVKMIINIIQAVSRDPV